MKSKALPIAIIIGCVAYALVMHKSMLVTLGWSTVILVNIMLLSLLMCFSEHGRRYIYRFILLMICTVGINHVTSYLLNIGFDTGTQWVTFYFFSLLFVVIYMLEMLTWPMHFRRWQADESVEQRINRGIGALVLAPFLLSLAIAYPLLDVRPLVVNELCLLAFSVITAASLANSTFFMLLGKSSIKTISLVERVRFTRGQYRFAQIFLVFSACSGLLLELFRGKWLFAVMNLMLYLSNLAVYHSVFRYASFKGEVQVPEELPVNDVSRLLRYPLRIYAVVWILCIIVNLILMFYVN